MNKGRLEAFSDGMIAIFITITVLDFKVPGRPDWASLRPLIPLFLTYVLSFVFIGIYWNNHHHMLNLANRINGRILWANLHLLFWLSFIPFVTGWLGETYLQGERAPLPTAAYGMVLLLAGVAYLILQNAIIAAQGPGSRLAEALGSDLKGKLSAGLYVLAIPSAFVQPLVSDAIYVLVALMWLVPDRRIESRLEA